VGKKFFEPDEYVRKKAALNDDERPVLIFGYNVGWRKQEVLTLKWDENIDFDSRTVRLWTGETKNDKRARGLDGWARR
jgi:integrase